jgi:hypothetical protein
VRAGVFARAPAPGTIAEVGKTCGPQTVRRLVPEVRGRRPCHTTGMAHPERASIACASEDSP